MDGQSRLSQQAVVDSVLTGLRDAVKGYFSISGWYLYNNEAFICSAIANSINRKFHGRDTKPRLWVTLETSNSSLKDFAVQTPGRKPKILEGNPRFDIVIWVGDDPYCVIEVKSNPTSRSTAPRNKDVARIKGLLKSRKYPKLKFGLFAYYIRCAKSNTYDENADRLVTDHDVGSNFDITLKRKKVRAMYDGEIENLGEACVLTIKYQGD